MPSDNIFVNLGKGERAIINAQDWGMVNNYNWTLHSSGYAQAKIKGQTVLMHQLIMGFPGGDIDHINLNKLDNRRENLRACNRSQNKANEEKRNGAFTSDFKGVDWRGDCKKWRATIRVNYIKLHLGMFEKEADAALAYDEAAKAHFGEYARLNRVDL